MVRSHDDNESGDWDAHPPGGVKPLHRCKPCQNSHGTDIEAGRSFYLGSHCCAATCHLYTTPFPLASHAVRASLIVNDDITEVFNTCYGCGVLQDLINWRTINELTKMQGAFPKRTNHQHDRRSGPPGSLKQIKHLY